MVAILRRCFVSLGHSGHSSFSRSFTAEPAPSGVRWA
jgi:hypothetical protein